MNQGGGLGPGQRTGRRRTSSYASNHQRATTSAEHKIITAAQLHHQALAPLVKVIPEAIGIKTRLHHHDPDVTNTQPIVDRCQEPARARRRLNSLIPTTTGSATRSRDLP